MARYEIRALLPGDEEQLLRVATHLDSVNLPDDKERIDEIVDLSHRSFTGAIKKVNEREYVFVMIDRENDHIVGTSMILAQLGRRGAPYIYFDVIDEEKYSGTIDRHFHHKLLRIGYSYDGPTEIGGLVMDPAYRTAPERLGSLISYVRFMFMAAHRELFRDEVVAELLPPLEPDGTSHLWEALGRKFTDMSYAEADLLSKKNKEFIKGLFPDGVVYASLLPKDAQDVIGKVGAQTRGVEKMLRRIGFRYADRVDPFDGGPHFFAQMGDIQPVRDTRKIVLGPPLATSEIDASKAVRSLIAIELDAAPFFRAVPGPALIEGHRARVTEDTMQHLGVNEGSRAVVLPLP